MNEVERRTSNVQRRTSNIELSTLDVQCSTLDVQTATRIGGLRSLIESLVCLCLAVILFRTFEVEGYMISTGSMAPSLFGYHKRVTCPACQFHFAHGIAFDESVEETVLGAEGLGPGVSATPRLAACPNCGQGSIDVSRIRRNQGDQLLVHKNAFSFHLPRRWDVIVFRNPEKSTQAFVKRVVGLPGERLQIIGGDLYVHGRIQRKSLTTQRAMRIPVFDHDYTPQNDPRWRPRWIPEGSADGSAWKADSNGFVIEEASESPSISWFGYRHWIREGGTHTTAVPLATPPPFERWPDYANDESAWPITPETPPHVVEYNRATQMLSCTGGVLADEWRDRLLAESSDPSFLRAVDRLADESHIAPISDTYGYNRDDGGTEPEPVRDTMLAANLTIGRGHGEFIVQMSDGRHRFTCVFDMEHDEVRLLRDDAEQPVRRSRLPEGIRDKTVLLEMSVFDRQVLVSVDGRLLFPLWEYDASAQPRERPSSPAAPSSRAAFSARRPVRLGAGGLAVNVRSLKLYRDVHYTRGKAKNGVDEPFELGADDYFVLGDNSPVSFDSRSWPDGALNGRLLVGKPFLVHLPSRPGQIKIGGRMAYIRVPDFARIRYIR